MDGEKVAAQIAQSEARLNQRLDGLKPDPIAKIAPGLFVLLGAIIAALAGYFTQRAKLNADEKLSRRTAAREAVAAIMDFRSRQLNEFYAPIRALQGQGLEIRNQLYSQLLANTKAGYTFYSKPDPLAATGESLWFKHAGVDKPFRMIEDMTMLQQHPQLMPLVDEIIKAGDATTKVIMEHGGLALPDNDKLTQMLGGFLAHHAILKQVRETASSQAVVTYTATYPRGFDKVILDDFKKLADELRAWKNSADSLIST